MQITRLDHYNISPRDLEASRRFYTEVIGLNEGWRPPFRAPGAWLYVGERPVVHLLVKPDRQDGPTGRIDHIAFVATGIADMIGNLRKHKAKFWLRATPGFDFQQLFVEDPDGVLIELNYAATERLPADAGEIPALAPS